MADIWQARARYQRTSKAPVVVWWLLALLWMGASAVSLALIPVGETTGDYALIALYGLHSQIVGALSVAFTFWIVRKIDPEHARNVTEQGGSSVIARPAGTRTRAASTNFGCVDGAGPQPVGGGIAGDLHRVRPGV